MERKFNKWNDNMNIMSKSEVIFYDEEFSNNRNILIRKECIKRMNLNEIVELYQDSKPKIQDDILSYVLDCVWSSNYKSRKRRTDLGFFVKSDLVYDNKDLIECFNKYNDLSFHTSTKIKKGGLSDCRWYDFLRVHMNTQYNYNFDDDVYLPKEYHKKISKPRILYFNIARVKEEEIKHGKMLWEVGKIEKGSMSFYELAEGELSMLQKEIYESRRNKIMNEKKEYVLNNVSNIISDIENSINEANSIKREWINKHKTDLDYSEYKNYIRSCLRNIFKNCDIEKSKEIIENSQTATVENAVVKYFNISISGYVKNYKNELKEYYGGDKTFKKCVECGILIKLPSVNSNKTYCNECSRNEKKKQDRERMVIVRNSRKRET